MIRIRSLYIKKSVQIPRELPMNVRTYKMMEAVLYKQEWLQKTYKTPKKISSEYKANMELRKIPKDTKIIFIILFK